MERQGYGFDEPEHYETDDDAQLILLGASLADRAALGLRAGRKVRRYQVLGGRTVRLPPRCAVCDGYNLHAGVVVRDAEARERLCRYVARPPLAKTRIEQREDGEMVVRLRRAWSDGRSAFVFSPLEFLERLAALIPPPRIHQIHYHGVLAPRHRWRASVTPAAEPRESGGALSRTNEHSCQTKARRLRWADLLWRTFRVAGWECPHCSERMTLRAVVVRPPATMRILQGLEGAAPARAPPAAPLRARSA